MMCVVGCCLLRAAVDCDWCCVVLIVFHGSSLFVVGCVSLVVVWLFVVCGLWLRIACCCLVVWVVRMFVVRCFWVSLFVCLLLFMGGLGLLWLFGVCCLLVGVCLCLLLFGVGCACVFCLLLCVVCFICVCCL